MTESGSISAILDCINVETAISFPLPISTAWEEMFCALNGATEYPLLLKNLINADEVKLLPQHEFVPTIMNDAIVLPPLKLHYSLPYSQYKAMFQYLLADTLVSICIGLKRYLKLPLRNRYHY